MSVLSLLWRRSPLVLPVCMLRDPRLLLPLWLWHFASPCAAICHPPSLPLPSIPIATKNLGKVFISCLPGLSVAYLSSLSHPQHVPAPLLLSCFPFHFYGWRGSKGCATHLLLFPLITLARLDSALLSDLLALQKWQKLLLSTGLCCLWTPWSSSAGSAPGSAAHSRSLEMPKALPHAMGRACRGRTELLVARSLLGCQATAVLSVLG